MRSAIVALLLALVASAATAFTGTPLNLHRSSHAASTSSAARRSSLVMRERACDLLGKTANRKARVITFSNKHIHKVQAVNLQWKRFYSDDLGRQVRLRLSTKGIKTVIKYGSIDAAAKKFGVNLAKY
jgi:ribosomal protein L28